MRTSFPYLRRTAVAAFLVILAGPAGRAAPQDDPDMLLCTFQARVSDYAALHQQVRATAFPPLVVTNSPHMLFAARAALAAGIRDRRRDARQGDIFSPGIAAMFRGTIERTLREHHVDIMTLIGEQLESATPVAIGVNVDYPVGGPVSFMPPCLLNALPTLPPGLQYRFVASDLILWDVDAGLIVDFVPNVLRIAT